MFGRQDASHRWSLSCGISGGATGGAFYWPRLDMASSIDFGETIEKYGVSVNLVQLPWARMAFENHLAGTP